MKTLSPEERKKKEEEDRKRRNSKTTYDYRLKTSPAKTKKAAKIPLKSSKLSAEELAAKKAEWDRERFAQEVEAAVDEFTKDHEPMLSLDDELVTNKDKETPPWE